MLLPKCRINRVRDLGCNVLEHVWRVRLKGDEVACESKTTLLRFNNMVHDTGSYIEAVRFNSAAAPPSMKHVLTYRFPRHDSS